MALFANRNIKSLFTLIISVLIIFIVAGQVLVMVISNDYKQSMLSHDYAVAGILKQENVASSIIQKAFSTNNKDAYLSGKELLQSSGYENELTIHFFRNVDIFYQKYALCLFIVSLICAACVITLLFQYFIRQESTLQKASNAIDLFMNGSTEIQLMQNEEGSLSRLFNSVHALATSLNSHIAQEKLNKEFLKDTISNISHQLKTPLSALRMYNEILQAERTENEVVTEFLNKTDRELNRIENLIMNLLKLARLDADSIILNRKNKKLKIFLEELTDDFNTRAKSEDKQIVLQCDENMNMYYDEEWFYEAISNIVKNSFDHTQAKDTISIICHETPALKEIIIRDNGSGIHPEDIHSIFKRFYRSRFSKEKQGTGIGLTLSKMIIEKHDGSITVESEPGKGTAFFLAFPKITNM